MNASQQDVTVLRSDPSISFSDSFGVGSGVADPPRVLKQRFVLEEKLGSGGMGTVFRAKDLRKVEARDRQPFLAIKVLNNNFRDHPEAFVALQREAAKSQAVSHPNIVSIYDFDKDGDVPFITMELLEGRELADLLRAYPNGLPDEMAWSVIRGICAGLKHAHSAGVVHADFKPGNVFVSPRNVPKILDFGIARAVLSSSFYGEDSVFDAGNLAALTPAYASREMLMGQPAEPGDDLYSLGVVIYLILTGRHPFGRVAADEAARDGLRAERPRRVSRRQWRVLDRCLAFDRQDRPGSVAELERFLLQPSPWRSRSLVAAGLAVVVTLGVNTLIGDVELSEVKEEVRQTTRLDVQTARLDGLLAQPDFDPVWEQKLVEELAVLDALGETTQTTDAKPESSAALQAGQTVRDEVRARYSARVRELPDLDQAFALYERGLQFGPLDDAWRHLHERSVAAMQRLLDQPQDVESWLAEMRQALARAAHYFPRSSQFARLRLDVADVMEKALVTSLRDGRFAVAHSLLDDLHVLRFDAATLDQLDTQVTAAETAFARRARELADRKQQRAMRADLRATLDQSCLRLDLAQVETALNARAGSQGARAASLRADGRKQIGQRLAVCVQQLANVDPDRAMALRLDAERRFGNLPALAAVTLDPCSPGYLVGNGAQTGRGGYCADKLANGASGPRLVVVPAETGAGRFAITKHEISWREFSEFCADSGACGRLPVASDDQLPVTRVPLAVVHDYAQWLTEKTGYRYRLPTAGEWQLAAQGAPDPNRNCRIQVDGLERGLAPVAANAGQANSYGAVNMLGNVQEWVEDGADIRALGGAFSDPITECAVHTARVHSGRADELTGFRLVREVS